ncbi:MAG: CocE/NonD family hydrolase [Actinomycetota bacterium]|nr:CocE/NonD family hydrolase [Actinomycetota bacterium]
MSTRVILERDVPCTLRDGTILMADAYRPDDNDRHPVLLQRTPYDKTFWPFTWAPFDPTKMAAAGYVVIIQDVRGRFMSGGTYDPYADEDVDGYDAVQWAASLESSNGRVGTYGISYMGGVQWLTASLRPPGLGAIATITSPNDAVENHYVRGGALQLGLVASWALASVAPNAVVREFMADPARVKQEIAGVIDDIDAIDEWLRRVPLVPFPPLENRGETLAKFFNDRVSTETREPRHDAISSSHRHGDISVPALQIAGWYDVLLQADLEHFAAMRSECGSEDARRLSRLIVGPWAHASFAPMVGEVDFGFRSAATLLDLKEDFTSLHRRWFDARLRGIDSGIDAEAPVKLFVMGRNRWRDEDAWPLSRAREQRWHVHDSGSLSPVPPADSVPSVFTLDPDDPVPTRGGNILMTLRHIRGPREQSPIERRDDVLVFTSDPITKELEVTGPVRFVCWIAAETVDTDVVARLCDVYPDGRSYNVVDGIRRLRFRESLREPKPLTPGEVVRVEVDMWATSHVFIPGHRLRLQVCASDFPRYDRCPGNGETSATAKQILPQRNKLFHDPHRPSHIVLPVVEG